MIDDSPNELVTHFFRHESGKLVASLVRFFGLNHFELVEDMVQSALVEALTHWKTHGIPDQPAAWIHRVAKNRVLDVLRRNTRLQSRAAEIAVDSVSAGRRVEELFDESELNDSQLRMIFACSHPKISPELAIPLTLRTLCGFSEEEIARGMLIERATVRKRIYRARQRMIEMNVSLELPSSRQLAERLHYVHNVLYLMFNEGYSSTNNESSIRGDVCEEAARLCHLLTQHRHCSTRTTLALLSLMLFHASRFESRVDNEGNLVLLEEQDRSLWDKAMIGQALGFVARAHEYGATSVYHLEATIAMQHCVAESFQATNWSAIIAAYDGLIEVRDSAIYRLNRAIAIAQRDGPLAGLEIVEAIRSDPMLQRSHLAEATLGELHRMQGNLPAAEQHFLLAIDKASSQQDKALLRRRVKQCQPDN